MNESFLNQVVARLRELIQFCLYHGDLLFHNPDLFSFVGIRPTSEFINQLGDLCKREAEMLRLFDHANAVNDLLAILTI